jgi:hypothetical protein
MTINQKTSLLIPSQLPEFIRDDPSYGNFVLFLQAYYEWLETADAANSINTIASTNNQGATYASKNLLNYDDVDNTLDEFLDYFYNEFLPFFPKDILADKQKTIKFAKELYQSKGTPASFKFLFRTLYNSDVDFFYTKDAVLRASAGKWYVAKSLRLATLDTNFLHIKNLRLFGETTKSIATVENQIVAGTKTEVFISNIQRLFQSGEFVRVVDANNQDVYFLDNKIVPIGTPGSLVLKAKIVGQISQVVLSKNTLGVVNSGNFYQPKDPVIVYGGLNEAITYPVGATAQVETTTLGSIKRINTLAGGYGYTDSNTANTEYTKIVIQNGGGATAKVGFLNPDPAKVANVALIPIDYIGLKTAGASYTGVQIGDSSHLIGYGFTANTFANYDSKLSDAFSFITFDTYPLASVLVEQPGSGISGNGLSVTAQSLYQSEYATYQADLKNLGILAPIQIINGGKGYQANDKINFTNGTGYGAYANVIAVGVNGSIVDVSYVYNTNEGLYPLGGMGYKLSVLPSLTVTSANTQAANAVLVVSGILGDGAALSPVTDQIGNIKSIKVTNPGEDYVDTPSVSIRVQDIVVKNVNLDFKPKSGDIVYQGYDANTASYLAYVDSIRPIATYENSLDSIYILRVYNYLQPFVNFNSPLIVESTKSNLILTTGYNFNDSRYQPLVTPGVLTYGDGTAEATASFLNGLIINQGQYLDTTGQPSSFDILQNENFNNYTYQITLEKEIAKYRDALLGLLHPTGMKVRGRYAIKTSNNYTFTAADALNTGYSLLHYTGTTNSNVTIKGSFSNTSNNTLQFNNLASANLENIILSNSIISFTATTGESISSAVVSVFDGTSNTVVLQDNVWVSFANVAYVDADANTNQINISAITKSYDIVNGGNYSNTAYPLKDIIRVGDQISVPNNSIKTVSTVDYTNSIVYLSSNLTNDVVNSFISINRTLVANANSVLIFVPVGLQYFSEI